MRRVFLDTVGLLALWNAQDQWHGPARRALGELTAEGVDFWTTTHVLPECGNAAAHTPFRHAVIEVRQHLAEAGRLIAPTDGDCAEAWATYARAQAGDAGIVEQVSFAVMRRLAIGEAFTNDQHFRAAGFQMLF